MPDNLADPRPFVVTPTPLCHLRTTVPAGSRLARDSQLNAPEPLGLFCPLLRGGVLWPPSRGPPPPARSPHPCRRTPHPSPARRDGRRCRRGPAHRGGVPGGEREPDRRAAVPAGRRAGPAGPPAGPSPPAPRSSAVGPRPRGVTQSCGPGRPSGARPPREVSRWTPPGPAGPATPPASGGTAAAAASASPASCGAAVAAPYRPASRRLCRRQNASARAAAELRHLLDSPAYSLRASEVGEQVRQEDGVRAACDALTGLLQAARPG
jgi:hypothetical protein